MQVLRLIRATDLGNRRGSEVFSTSLDVWNMQSLHIAVASRRTKAGEIGLDSLCCFFAQIIKVSQNLESC